MHGNSTTFNRDRLKFKPKTPKAWSHEDELQALRGKVVKLTMVDDTWPQGVLLEADRYTVMLGHGHLGQSKLTYFKSAIVSFQEVTL